MNFNGNVWFVNFSGIGNGIIIAPILACFEKSFKTTKYFHTENEVLSDELFISRAGLKNIIGFTPIKWRRFNEDDWESIMAFVQKNNISYIVNLRNEGPKYDTGYYAFKKHVGGGLLTFVDLDFDTITSRKKQVNLTADIIDLFSLLGVNMSLYNPNWLIGEGGNSDGIGFGMAGSHKNKRWGISKWIILAKQLCLKGEKIVLFPGKSRDEIVAAYKVKEVIGSNCEIVEFDCLYEVAERLRCLRMFITNDTGLLHISAASDVYTIGIYVCTDPIIWAPLKRDNFVSLENSNFIYCPSRKIHCGNCAHYYDVCPSVANHEDDINPQAITDLIESINRFN